MWIYEKITEYTGVTDAAEVVEIYGFMCDSVRAFSSLSPAQFRKEAREAKAVNDYIKTPAGKAEWERLNAKMGAAA
jgi:hypothetical protein